MKSKRNILFLLGVSAPLIMHFGLLPNNVKVETLNLVLGNDVQLMF